MYLSKKRWQQLEKRVADLEKVTNALFNLEITPDVFLHPQTPVEERR